MKRLGFVLVVACLALVGCAQSLSERYRKIEYRIPMRDGVKLYTAVYVPVGKPGPHPILLERTPYSAGPYGERMPRSLGGKAYEDAGYAFAFQDVRGRFMSEGKWMEIRPRNRIATGPHDVDEVTDAYDTIEFLVKNVPENNGRVGVTGVSYPGFYASMAAACGHPALKAASPQAPVTEWFLGDDVHHNGAFFLQENFDFYFWFGLDKDAPAEDHPQIESFGRRPDAYKFFLDLGPLKNADERYFKGRIPFWKEICEHPDMDDFWQARHTPDSLSGVACPTLTVGGWFDAENLYGALHTDRGVRRHNPRTPAWLVMGPWTHGGWGGGGDRLGAWRWPVKTGEQFRNEIEFPFFEAFLREKGPFKQAAFRMFDTGTGEWVDAAVWPPKVAKTRLHLGPNQTVGPSKPSGGEAEIVSDPADPVPYKTGNFGGRDGSYMFSDQTFAEARPDVLTFASAPLTEDLRWAGPLRAHFAFRSTGTDGDLVVKVIDGFPADAPEGQAGAKLMVRADVFRLKYRDSFQNPRPLVPGAREMVDWEMPDLCHTFKKGHRVIVQVQGSWFPLVDRNPNRFLNIFAAEASDFQKATVTLDLADCWLEAAGR